MNSQVILSVNPHACGKYAPREQDHLCHSDFHVYSLISFPPDRGLEHIVVVLSPLCDAHVVASQTDCLG